MTKFYQYKNSETVEERRITLFWKFKSERFYKISYSLVFSYCAKHNISISDCFWLINEVLQEESKLCAR